MRTVFHFDFECERELERWPRPYAPPRPGPLTSAVTAAARALLGPGDGLLDELVDGAGQLPPPWRGARGVSWCATPSSRAKLLAAGAEPVPGAPVELLRALASRRLHLELGPALPGGFWAETVGDLARAGEHGLAGPPFSAAWIAKRGFRSGGRGVRRFRGGFGGARLVRGDREWLDASFAAGGLEIEPLVHVQRELGQHGRVHPDGRLELGRPTEQTVDGRGHWQGSRAATDLDRSFAVRLLEESERVGAWLGAKGYVGPFGIDALVYRTPAGGSELCARSEVHGRFSLGWAVGMGLAESVALAPAPRVRPDRQGLQGQQGHRAGS